MDARRETVQQTIKRLNRRTEAAQEEGSPPFLDHSWRQMFFELVYHATTNDRTEVLYSLTKKAAVWLTHEGRSLADSGTEMRPIIEKE